MIYTTPCNRYSLSSPVDRSKTLQRESTAVDPNISSFACATSVSTYVPATALILTRVDFALSFFQAARVPCHRARSQSFSCHTINLYIVHNAHPLHWRMHRRLFTTSNTSTPITPNFCMLLHDFLLQNLPHIGRKPVTWSTEQSCHTPWQHACRTKFMHTCKCDDHGVRPQQILETSARAIARQHVDPRENKERHIRKKRA